MAGSGVEVDSLVTVGVGVPHRGRFLVNSYGVSRVIAVIKKHCTATLCRA